MAEVEGGCVVFDAKGCCVRPAANELDGMMDDLEAAQIALVSSDPLVDDLPIEIQTISGPFDIYFNDGSLGLYEWAAYLDLMEYEDEMDGYPKEFRVVAASLIRGADIARVASITGLKKGFVRNCARFLRWNKIWTADGISTSFDEVDGEEIKDSTWLVEIALMTLAAAGKVRRVGRDHWVAVAQ